MLGSISFGLYELADEAIAGEIAALRLLAPHFRRAITISDLFDMKAVEASTFAAALDTLNAGTLLVDENLGIVHANSAAERMLSEGTAVQSQRGRVAVGQKAAGDALEAAVRQASRDEVGLGQKGIGIPAAQAGEVPTVIHVLPLRGGDFRPGLAPRAAAALFVTPSSVPPGMPRDALAVLYDLTPAEVRVVELLCAGSDQAEVAATLGIAKSTVKTHLLSVFAKTGCSRQVDLVKLATGLAHPM
jgi:DNA-binding CsgD family transcriptional regulator